MPPRGKSKGAQGGAALVDAILKKYGAFKDVREHRLVIGWADLVGERVAARAWPDGLSKGVLYVRVANSAWLHELSFLREALAEKANALVGGQRLVKDVRFHLGPRRDTAEEEDVIAELARRAAARRRPAAPSRPPPSIAGLERIDRETDAVSDPELRATLRALRRRLGL